MSSSREYMRKYMKEYQRKRVARLKGGKSCLLCPESFSFCLEFHHVDRASKVNNVTTLVNRGAAWDVVLAEAAKCVLLCANCHRKVEAGVLSVEGK